MTIRFLDPTVTAEAATVTVAARLPDLDGKVVGLLANGKTNADRLLGLVSQRLGTRYSLREVVTLAKDNASRPAPPAIIDELAARCDAVVTAIGD